MWSVPVRTAEFNLVMRRSDREPSGSHAPQQHPALRCSVRPTDRPFRPRISGGRTNTEVHPVANLQHNGPLQAVPSVQADPPARTPGSSGRLTLRVDGHSGPRHLARCRTWAKCRFWSKAGVDDKGRAQEPNRALRCLTAAETFESTPAKYSNDPNLGRQAPHFPPHFRHRRSLSDRRRSVFPRSSPGRTPDDGIRPEHSHTTRRETAG